MFRSLREHLDDPVLIDPPTDGSAIEGCAGGSCGVVVRFFLHVEDGVIRACTARVRGRAAAFAAASAFCEAATGLSVVDAARLGLTTLHSSFCELSDDDHDRARVIEDGFHHALGQWCIAQMRDRAHGAIPAAGRPQVAVAMSGGVDSAVALHAEFDATAGAVAGVTLRLWIDPQAPDPEAACCSPDSVRRARATCHALGVPHISLDLRSMFARDVVAPFIAQYSAGETPNPCVACNGNFRLDELVYFADVVGAAHVATGHYVRRVERAGRALIQRGVDRRKDQSYMLARLDPAVVARFRFPLGGMEKPAVRARATELGLAQATAAESQEVCFLGGGDYRAFLRRADALGTPGALQLEDGTVLAQHDGIARFTPGQRRGIAVTRPRQRGDGIHADNRPLYVLATNPESGTVTVGDREQLAMTAVALRDVRMWASDVKYATAQLRYRAGGGGERAQLVPREDGRAELHFEGAVWAPAPGQAAVLYDDDGVVVGVGTIDRSPGVVGGEPNR